MNCEGDFILHCFFLECEKWIITVKPDKYCLKVEKLELPL